MKAQAMFLTLKRKYQRKKRELKGSNKSGTSAEAVSKAEKAFHPYLFLNWLDEFFAPRLGKTNLRSNDLEFDGEGEGCVEECEEEEEIQEKYESSFEEDTSITTDNVPTSSKKTKCSEEKKKRRRMEIKGSARENLLEDMEFSLIKNLNEKVSEKKKAKDQDRETTEDLFCKLLAADLKMLPVYERFIARNEIRGVMFKLQMSVLKKQQSQTNPPNQTYFNQNVVSPTQAPFAETWPGPSTMSSPASTGSWGETL